MVSLMDGDRLVHTLVDERTGHLAFKLYGFADNSHFDHVQRHNYYTVLWVAQGRGRLRVDTSAHDFHDGHMMCFTPYQPFMLSADAPVNGIALHFHSDLYCIHKHQHEVACNGVLFNDLYDPPLFTVDAATGTELRTLVDQMHDELVNTSLARTELLVSYLKIFLIKASRMKLHQCPGVDPAEPDGDVPMTIAHLKSAIEEHYRTKHAPGDYAILLHITPKSLSKLVKQHFNRTPTDLIAERIMIEAKRELYLSDKSVKVIAHELGFDDAYYFSRFFKRNAEVSPELYRKHVGFAKG
jgi:AraC family transcriptional activator of pobA